MFSLRVCTYRIGGTKMFILTICADMAYLPGEKLSLSIHFAPMKDFADVYNVKHPGQT